MRTLYLRYYKDLSEDDFEHIKELSDYYVTTMKKREFGIGLSGLIGISASLARKYGYGNVMVDTSEVDTCLCLLDDESLDIVSLSVSPSNVLDTRLNTKADLSSYTDRIIVDDSSAYYFYNSIDPSALPFHEYAIETKNFMGYNSAKNITISNISELLALCSVPNNITANNVAEYAKKLEQYICSIAHCYIEQCPIRVEELFDYIDQYMQYKQISNTLLFDSIEYTNLIFGSLSSTKIFYSLSNLMSANVFKELYETYDVYLNPTLPYLPIEKIVANLRLRKFLESKGIIEKTNDLLLDKKVNDAVRNVHTEYYRPKRKFNKKLTKSSMNRIHQQVAKRK